MKITKKQVPHLSGGQCRHSATTPPLLRFEVIFVCLWGAVLVGVRRLRRNRHLTVRLHVTAQVLREFERSAAHVARERPLVRVDGLVTAQVLPVDERPAADVAPVVQLAAVALHMQSKATDVRVRLRADLAAERSRSVCPLVRLQRRQMHESSAAHVAHQLPLAGVQVEVRLQIALFREVAATHVAAEAAHAFVHRLDVRAQRTAQPELVAAVFAREGALARVHAVVEAHARHSDAQVLAAVALEAKTSLHHQRHLLELLGHNSFALARIFLRSFLIQGHFVDSHLIFDRLFRFRLSSWIICSFYAAFCAAFRGAIIGKWVWSAGAIFEAFLLVTTQRVHVGEFSGANAAFEAGRWFGWTNFSIEFRIALCGEPFFGAGLAHLGWTRKDFVARRRL